ncbi:hypothetical protein DL98DRAFT_649130 [Cadophora sp. DSE1049]|nr:hypothetical protein DL98DRAFT_649130 [Cadophora sp. DSE1049]
MCIIPRRKPCPKSKDLPKTKVLTTTTVHCPYQASQPRNSPIPPHFISQRTKTTQSSKSTKSSQPQPPAASTSVTAMYASHLPPWTPVPTPPPGYIPYPGWTQISQPYPHTYSQYGVYPPIWPGLPTQPPAQPASPPPPTKDPIFLTWEKDNADAFSQRLAEEKAARDDAALKRQIMSKVKFADDFRKELNPPPSASVVAAKEAADRKESEKRRRDEEDLQRLRREDEDRKLTQRIQAGLSPIDASVKELKKAEEDRQLQERIEKAASNSKLEGKAEGRAAAIKEEERHWLVTGRGRRSRLRSRSQSRDSSSERSRSRSRRRTRGRNYGGVGGSRGAHGSGQGFGNDLYDPETLLRIGADIAMSQSPRSTAYASQPLIEAPSNYNTFQQNQAVRYAGGRAYPPYSDKDIVFASQFESTARSISGKLDQFGQGQQTVLDRLERVDTKLSQGHQHMLNRFGHIDMTLENMSGRLSKVGI